MDIKKLFSGKNCSVEKPLGADGSFDDAGQEIMVDALRSNLQTVLDFIDARLKQCGCPRRTQMQINLTVEEIFVNIANYAYPGSSGSARIGAEILKDPEPAGIRITFTDQGIPYNPLAKPDPDVTLSAKDRPIGGLGIFLVKKTMDQIEYRYENSCNILTMTKYFPK